MQVASLERYLTLCNYSEKYCDGCFTYIHSNSYISLVG